MPNPCSCLAQYDGTLAHYVHCDILETLKTKIIDGSAARTLAELASYRDIDTALACLRELKGN